MKIDRVTMQVIGKIAFGLLFGGIVGGLIIGLIIYLLDKFY